MSQKTVHSFRLGAEDLAALDRLVAAEGSFGDRSRALRHAIRRADEAQRSAELIMVKTRHLRHA